MVRVPGRICLLGEHCDWAGGASLVAPLPLAITARFTPGGEGLRVRSGALSARYPLPSPPIAGGDALRYVAAVAAELHERGRGVPPGELVLESDLPRGRGFSSSAALCVAAALALAPGLGPERAAEVAYAAERGRVGVACGRLDQLACALARPLRIRWRGGEPQAGEVAGPPLTLVAAAFPAPRDAPGILDTLARHHRGEGEPARCAAVRRVIAGWGRLALEGAAAWEAGDVGALGAAMSEAQSRYEVELAGLPALAAPGLTAACAAARAAGALGAKFSGAGGDGSVVALARDPEHAAALRALLVGRGLAAWAR